MGLQPFWATADGVTRAVALLLLAMSLTAWVLIFWKGWLLLRVRRDLARAVPLFWAAPDLEAAQQRLAGIDREAALCTMLAAARAAGPADSLDAMADAEARLTRRLRDAMQAVLQQLQYGQVALASVGATAPFVGLLGTVWGIYHALGGIAASGSVGIDKVAGPVGEALIMTAAGLAVAIPAVLAYNVFGRWVAGCEVVLEGWAHDVRALLLNGERPTRG